MLQYHFICTTFFPLGTVSWIRMIQSGSRTREIMIKKDKISQLEKIKTSNF
jgi:hypothetical protein